MKAEKNVVINDSLVIYTDGSFITNDDKTYVGFRGSGAHGYFYSSSQVGKGTSNRPHKFLITTRGYKDETGYKETDKIKLVNPTYYVDASYSYVNHGSAQTAELEAVVELLQSLINNTRDYEDIKLNNILLLLDSQYVIDCLNKIFTNQSWKEDASNLEVLNKLKDLINQLQKEPYKIKFEVEKVIGHSGNIGNDNADTLAKYGRIQSCVRNIFKSFVIQSASKYWSKDESRHPMLRYKQLFFTNTLKAPNDEIIYSVMNYATDTEPGRKTHNACFGLVSLKEHQDIIEDAIKAYHELSYKINSQSVVSTLNLDNLYNRNTTHYFDMFKDRIFNLNRKTMNLSNLHNDPIVYTINPGGLALQALDKMSILHNIITEYRNTKDFNALKNKFYFDITDKIFDTVENKKKEKLLKIKIENGVNDLKFEINLEGKPVNVNFDLGKDTLSRNQFKALEKTLKKVYLIVYKLSDEIYNYYTLVDLGEEGIGVFCNFYSGKLYIDPKKK